jgi:hypothetical protein
MASVQEGCCQVEVIDVIIPIRASSSGGFVAQAKQHAGFASDMIATFQPSTRKGSGFRCTDRDISTAEMGKSSGGAGGEGAVGVWSWPSTLQTTLGDALAQQISMKEGPGCRSHPAY